MGTPTDNAEDAGIPVFDTVEHHGRDSVAVGPGHADDGQPSSSTGDVQSPDAIAEAIEEVGDPVLAYVSDWQADLR